MAADPIYATVATIRTSTETNMQPVVILKFLAASRRYLDR